MEQERKDHIKDIFSSRLKDLEQDPPVFIWGNIEKQLSEQEVPIVAQPKRRSSLPQYITWSAGVAAAVILGVFIFKNNEPHSIGYALDDTPEYEMSSLRFSQRISEPDNKLNEVQNEISASLYAKNYSLVKANMSKGIGQSALIQKSNGIFPTDQAVGNNQRENSPELSPHNVLLVDNNETKSTEKESIDNKQNQEGKVLKDIQKQIDAFEAEGRKAEALLADNSDDNLNNNSSSSDFALAFAGGGALSKADSYKKTIRPVANADQQIFLRSETVKLEHNQPINFGLTINKKINNHFSLESGISYTYLSSKVKSSSTSLYSQNDMQYFHYLGVPLNLNYNFVEWKKLKVYLSVGGVVQKDIYGRLDRYRLVNNAGGNGTTEKNKKNISQKNIQMSVNSSFGLSYPIYNNISVYTTVGGAYYFDAKNEYETIYSDKKWLLNLNLGLKFDF